MPRKPNSFNSLKRPRSGVDNCQAENCCAAKKPNVGQGSTLPVSSSSMNNHVDLEVRGCMEMDGVMHYLFKYKKNGLLFFVPRGKMTRGMNMLARKFHEPFLPKSVLKGDVSQMNEPGNGDIETSNRNSIIEKEDGSGSASGSAVFSTPSTSVTQSYQPDLPSDTNTIEVFKEESKPKEKGGRGDAISALPATVPVPTADYRFLYQVQGTYKYNAEDVDELSFNVGDIIDVVAIDDPEEQKKGWLTGVFNEKKGLFPANFTSRI